ncbi:MAG: hypothetical protein R3E57_03690 [Porticoccaceae bacterium]
MGHNATVTGTSWSLDAGQSVVYEEGKSYASLPMPRPPMRMVTRRPTVPLPETWTPER